MQRCNYCGADLPENARFCGQCGSVQEALATDVAATRSQTPPPSWVPEGSSYLPQNSTPVWSPIVQEPTTPSPVPVDENEEERRRGISSWSSQYSAMYGAALGADALMSSGQAYAPGVPGVQGTPQMGSVPGVAGSPNPYASAPVSPPTPGPANVPGGHLAQELANVPVSHPAQGTLHTPFPQTEPQPTHELPEQPGTQEHHPPQKHHERHTPRAHHAARVTKVAGGSTVKTVMIVITAAVVVVAAGGVAAAAHFLSLPQPLINVASNYRVGNTPAGASGTILHISGQKFSSNSPITLLLDGHVAPGNTGTRSDSNGNFSANVAITDAWGVGTHTLTARDASNYSTKTSVKVTVVQPGQANTPGPDGAPPDDASFKVIAQIQGSQSTETEIVTGHPDPMGGTVCQPEDSGQPIVTTGVTSPAPIPVRKTRIYSCIGSYKGGKLTLTETVRSDVRAFSLPDGTTTTCTLNSPQPDEQISGSYTGNNTFSGTITYPAIPDSDYTCHGDGTYYFYNFEQYQQDKWTGQVTDLHT